MLAIILLTIIGCCVGSFLNVVVYRLPLGKSLSFPPSHCPQCKHPIRFYDNVPVFGWFLLGGRCRDCRSHISLRYPVVEFISGLVLGSISCAVYFHGGGLPYFEFVLTSLYYFVLVMTLFAAGLIEFDRKVIPAELFIPVTIITPFMFYYLGNIEFQSALNGAGLFYAVAATIICCAIMSLNFRYFVKLEPAKKRLPKKHSSKKYSTQKQFRLQIIVPFCTALVLGFGCGLISVPILFFGTIISMLFLRYKKSRRLYLFLAGAIWVTIIYILVKF
ncbi:MAG: prepilin peptidase [Planctomycetaceae bacterium]|jgi:hypothetical protein|nr:prepilin peptidase [Planctomycetaceae bacterium]